MTKEERSWVMYDWANSAYSMVITTALLQLYFKQHVAAGMRDVDSTAYWGYANTIATLLIAVLAPVLGALADHRGYKKKLFAGLFFVGLVSTAALGTAGEGMWLWCLIVYGISSIGFDGAIIFYDAFIVDVAKPERRDWISASGFAWGYIGGTIPFLAAAAVYMKPELIGLSSAAAGARVGFLITAAWWLVFTIPLLRNVKQIHYVDAHPHPIQESVQRIARTLRQVAHHKNIFVFLAAFFLYIDGVHTIIKMAFSFGVDMHLSEMTLVIGLIVVQLVAFPCALIYGVLARHFGAKALLMVGVLTYVAVTIIGYYLHTAWQFYLLVVLVGSAQGGIQSLSRSLYSRIIPQQNAAEFFGFYDVFGKFAAVLGPALVGISAQLTGNTRYGILSLIVLFILGGLLLTLVHDERSHGTQAP